MKKRMLLTGLTILLSCFLYLPLLHAQAGEGDEPPCTEITTTIPENGESALRAALQPYSQETETAVSYCLRFVFEDNFVPEYSDPFIIGVSPKVKLQVEGLNVRVRAGLKIQGGGHVVLKDSTITGVADGGVKPDHCISVASEDTELDNVEVSNCSRGILVEANGVEVQNGSKIHGNEVGIYVASGKRALTVKGSRIYENTGNAEITDRRKRNIHFASESDARELKFMTKVVGKEIEKQPEVNAAGENTYSYAENEPFIIKLPDAPSEGSELSFYATTSAGCGQQITPQLCELIKTIPVSQAATQEVASDLSNKTFVVVYTHPTEGSTLVSPLVKMIGNVAFVTTTMDMPSLPGAGVAGNEPVGGGGGGGGSPPVETGNENKEEAANEDSGSSKFDAGTIGSGTVPLGTDDSTGSTVAAGTGEGGVIAASIAAGCSLSPSDDPIRLFAMGLNLWWLIFAVAVIGSLKAVKVRIRRRK